MSKLLVVNDGKRERELLLVETLVVGRDPACDISHDDALLSRRHAEFLSARDEVTVRDLGSRNGIFVNGTRAAERSLRPGDVVQIGPLRVRYVAESAPVNISADELDIDATKVVPPPPGLLDRPSAAPPVELPEDELDEVAEGEEETRIFQTPAGVHVERPTHEAGLSGDEATSVIPPPPRPPNSRIIPPSEYTARPQPTPDAPSVRPSAGPAPMLAVPEAHAVAPVEEGSITAFVFVQLAALSSVIFVASAVPLIMWRGEGLGAPNESGALALLRWPGLPIVIALAATYVVATLVNRRFLDALMAAKQDQSSRGVERDSTRNSTGLPRA